MRESRVLGLALLKPLMMKRSRSDSEGGGRPELKVEVPVRHNISSCQPRARSPPSLSHPQTSLSLASSDGRAAAPDLAWGSNAVTTQRDSRSDSASSRETWPTQGTSQQDMTGGGQGPEDDEVGEEDGELEEGEQTVVHRVNNSNRIQPRDVMREGLEVMAERMRDQPDELLEELKMDIRDILGSPQRRDEFLLLQRLLRVRRDLTRENLMRAHRIQLEIFVALRTGILAFILPDISVTHTALVEIFFHKRCRNMACQSQLPANECSCECCRSMNGFCNSCMCVACSKFDFESNSLRWIGCDVCLHWTHADCALRAGAFFMGVSSKEKPKLGTSHTGRRSELMFRCRACGNGSELLGWAKDVFRLFASHWDRDTLIRELNYVHRIFHVSDDTRGKHFYWKFEELLEKLQNGMDTNTAIRDIQCFCQEPEVEESKDGDREEKLFDRREVCDRVADIVQEAISKLATVAEEKSSQLKKAQVTLGVRERELDDRKRELAELQFEKQRKKQQIEELESIVRLKKAEADMFQFKSDEARREAEALQSIVAAKSEKVEEEYATRYLKLRLDEAEAERRLLFDKLQGPDAVRWLRGADPSQTVLLNKIHGLFERVGMVSTMPDTAAPFSLSNTGASPTKPSSSGISPP